jgi:hypothetical protein
VKKATDPFWKEEAPDWFVASTIKLKFAAIKKLLEKGTVFFWKEHCELRGSSLSLFISHFHLSVPFVFRACRRIARAGLRGNHL